MYPSVAREDYEIALQVIKDPDSNVRHQIPKLLVRAIQANEVELLSLILSLPTKRDPSMSLREWDDWICGKFQQGRLLEETLTNDSAECALALLNCLEQRRQRLDARPPEPLPDGLTRQQRREHHCLPGVDRVADLEALAGRAMAQSATRVARASLLHAHRLLPNKRPVVGGELKYDRPAGQQPVPWPAPPCDMVL